jgi:hypothetical protein
MVAAGHKVEPATAAAYGHARRDYFRKFPQGALPEWLAYPRNRRLRSHYDTNGHPVEAGAYQENPAPNAKEVRRAANLYEDFTGHAATEVREIPVRPLPKTALAVGRLVMVGYESNRDGKLYKHTFRESSRPLLLAAHDGKQVVIAGGRYAFTDAGIVDK